MAKSVMLKISGSVLMDLPHDLPLATAISRAKHKFMLAWFDMPGVKANQPDMDVMYTDETHDFYKYEALHLAMTKEK